LKSYKGMVYTATPSSWDWSKPMGAEKIYDKSGRLLVEVSGGGFHGSGKGVSEQFLGLGGKGAESSGIGKEVTSPTVYQSWLRDVKTNKAMGEFVGFTEGGRRMKVPKFKYPVEQDIGYVIGQKREVETWQQTYQAIQVNRAGYIRRMGWAVPIIEQELGTAGQLQKSISAMGLSSSDIGAIGISSLPSYSTSSIPKSVWSSVSFPKQSSSRVYKIKSSVPLYSSSNVSKIISNISKISSPSTKSSKSSSFNSSVSKIISSITSGYSSYSSSTSTSRVTKPKMLPFITGIAGAKKQIKKKYRKTPEILGLFPDFTSRAIGLAPKKVGSVKDAMKEIRKLQTGFEIRRGARLPVSKNPSDIGFSGISEKKLMKGIMK